MVSELRNHLNRSKFAKLSPEQRRLHQMFTKAEKFLDDNKDICIVDADKGGQTVVMTKEHYNEMIMNLINDTNTYKEIPKDLTDRMQRKNNALVKFMFENQMIDTKTYKSLTTYKAVCPRIYALPKVHKLTEGQNSRTVKGRPIVSNVNGPTSALSRWIGEIVRKAIDQSQFNIPNSFAFVEKIRAMEVPEGYKLISLDVVSLFTCIPFDLLTDLIERKWERIDPHTTMDQNTFLQAVEVCARSPFFRFNNKFYLQKLGFPMGASASPSFSDFVMEDCLEISVEKLPFIPPFINKYVDDLCMCVPQNSVNLVLDIFNSYHPCIQFTMEQEANNVLPFLDTLLMRHVDGSLDTRWYKKPCASGRILNFKSAHPMQQKINTAKNFVARVVKLTTIDDASWVKNTIYEGLKMNDYPPGMTRRWINDALSTKTAVTLNQQSDPPELIYKSIAAVPGLTQRLASITRRWNESVKISVKAVKTVSSLYTKLKDRLDDVQTSDVIYSFPCKECRTVRYYGMTTQLLKKRAQQHEYWNSKMLEAREETCRRTREAKEKEIASKTAALDHAIKYCHQFNVNKGPKRR